MNMDKDKPGILPALLAIFKTFDALCKEHGIDYSIVSDERDRQGYLVGHAFSEKIDGLVRRLSAAADEGGVHMETDRNHRQGTLLTFTLQAIQDGRIHEDQYKWATGKLRRKQSMWPQSFGRSKSFGGVTDGFAIFTPTKVTWRGMTRPARITEDVNRLSDLGDLFDALWDATKARDADRIDEVSCAMRLLASDSAALMSAVNDAVNGATYADINDVGYARDRFRSVFLPRAAAPGGRQNQSAGAALVVEQFEVESLDGTFIVPANQVGMIESAGALTLVSFDAPRLRVRMTPSMALRHLQPISRGFSARLDALLAEGGEEAFEPQDPAEKALLRAYAMSPRFHPESIPSVLGAIWAIDDAASRTPPTGMARMAYDQASGYLRGVYHKITGFHAPTRKGVAVQGKQLVKVDPQTGISTGDVIDAVLVKGGQESAVARSAYQGWRDLARQAVDLKLPMPPKEKEAVVARRSVDVEDPLRKFSYVPPDKPIPEEPPSFIYKGKKPLSFVVGQERPEVPPQL
jgi:hypothetical protein